MGHFVLPPNFGALTEVYMHALALTGRVCVLWSVLYDFCLYHISVAASASFVVVFYVLQPLFFCRWLFSLALGDKEWLFPGGLQRVISFFRRTLTA